MNRKIIRFLFVNLGLFIMSISVHFFLTPDNLASGGIFGLALVLKKYIPSINVGAFMLICNVFLLFLAFLLIGADFGGYTIYSGLALSGYIMMLDFFIPVSKPLTDDIMLNLIYAILIQGVVYAFIFQNNASTGGTDILAKIINKYTKIPIGRSLMFADFLIVLAATFAFGMKLGMYAMLGIIINSFVVDKAIAGFNTKVHITIISSKYEEINSFIINKLERGSTLYRAIGGYSNKEVIVIYSVVSLKEYLQIKKYVEEIDPKAFIIIHFVQDVFGEGFTFGLPE